MEVRDRVCRAISPKDTMMIAGEESQYFSVGEAGLQICKDIMKGHEPKRIIDFPSGYGRVLRWLRAEWPHSEIVAIEIDPEALSFVTDTFGAIPLTGDPHLEMEIPGNADLIFSGSLLTHLDDWQWDRYLNICIEALSPDGYFVFTTHGRIAAEAAKKKDPLYGNLINTSALYAEYVKNGFAFLPYSKDYPTYGLSLSSPEWVMRRLQAFQSVKIVTFEEGRWGQDVVALQRNRYPRIPFGSAQKN